ncbi:hypothetical protein F5Y10DRAFT_201285 [Nemania abortiva]|nr:hypothetical protein F5Y10DRAFT_201285 [Nemania abortiva]
MGTLGSKLLSNQPSTVATAASCSGGPDVSYLFPVREHAFGPRGHFVVSANPFKCRCGKEFAKLFTLERHIQQFGGAGGYPCTECTVYQDKSAFKRKDHLVQHLRCIHGYDDDKLATLYPPRQSRRFQIPVCHFQSCEYYRSPAFGDLPIGEQEKNRPFDKQSHYTTHMKLEHDWSPYTCKVPGCDKIGRKGFFSATSFGKHCKDKHPGATIAAPVVRTRGPKTVRCDYCRKTLTSSTLGNHQSLECDGQATCQYCDEVMKATSLFSHEHYSCKGKKKCVKCLRLVERREFWSVDWCASCRGGLRN